MAFYELYNTACRFIVRSALDIAAFWAARYFYLRWRGEVEEQDAEQDALLAVPLGQGETLATHARRKFALGEVWRAIWHQQKCFRGGEECKQWFVDEIQALSVSKFGNAREIQGRVMHAAPEYSP